MDYNLASEEIGKLPTIVDILEHIACEEEFIRSNDNLLSYSDLGKENKFTVQTDDNGLCNVLYPSSSSLSLFRGQNQYFTECKPSIFRDEGLSEIELFIDVLKRVEFENVLSTFPFTKQIETGLSYYLNNETHTLPPIKIDYCGLSQHYEFKTSLLDFTNDKWVAAFFASCQNDKGQYKPIESEGYGVFYFLSPSENELKGKLSIIGLQPFKRPGEQKAFALKMNRGENINNFSGVEKFLFRHDRQAAQIIYNRMNKGNLLFPNDALISVSNKIKRSKKFSVLSFRRAIQESLDLMLSEIEISNELKNRGIKIVNYQVNNISKKEMSDISKQWENSEKQKFLAKIMV